MGRMKDERNDSESITPNLLHTRSRSDDVKYASKSASSDTPHD
jgi:hypothetical protein